MNDELIECRNTEMEEKQVTLFDETFEQDWNFRYDDNGVTIRSDIELTKVAGDAFFHIITKDSIPLLEQYREYAISYRRQNAVLLNREFRWAEKLFNNEYNAGGPDQEIEFAARFAAWFDFMPPRPGMVFEAIFAHFPGLAVYGGNRISNPARPYDYRHFQVGKLNLPDGGERITRHGLVAIIDLTKSGKEVFEQILTALTLIEYDSNRWPLSCSRG